MISATEVPDSACRERKRNLLFTEMLLFHPKKPPFLVMPRFRNLTSRLDQEIGRTSSMTCLPVNKFDHKPNAPWLVVVRGGVGNCNQILIADCRG